MADQPKVHSICIRAYLVLLENLRTRTVTAEIWSSPPWQQTQILNDTVASVLFETSVHKTISLPPTESFPIFEDARKDMLSILESVAKHSNLMAWALNEVLSRDCYACHMLRFKDPTAKCEDHSGAPNPWAASPRVG